MPDLTIKTFNYLLVSLITVLSESVFTCNWRQLSHNAPSGLPLKKKIRFNNYV